MEGRNSALQEYSAFYDKSFDLISQMKSIYKRQIDNSNGYYWKLKTDHHLCTLISKDGKDGENNGMLIEIFIFN